MKRLLAIAMTLLLIATLLPDLYAAAGTNDKVDYVETIEPGDLLREGRLLYSGFTTTEVRNNDHGYFRFADLSQAFIYRIPILKGADSVSIEIEIANRFLVDESSDNENWVTLFREEEDIFNGENVQTHIIELTQDQLKEQFYFLRMSCRNPESGWGGMMYPFTITQTNAEPGQDMFALRFDPLPVSDGLERYSIKIIPGEELELDVLYSGGALTEVKELGGEPFRYADATQTFIYQIPLPKGISELKINSDIANRYRLSISADGEDFTDIYVCERPVQILDNRVKLTKTLGDEYKGEYLYVKMGDALLEGWGGCAFSIELAIVATAGQAYPYTGVAGDNGGDGGAESPAPGTTSQSPGVSPGSDPSEPGKDSVNWLLIICIVIGGIVVIVAVAVIVLKSRQKRT